MSSSVIRIFKLVSLVAISSAAWGQSLVVMSPGAGSVVKGPLTFSATAQGIAPASVEYVLNGRLASGALSAPFSWNWHTALYWDGPQTVQAIGRDANGVEIVRSAAVPFTIANGITSIRLVSPNTQQTVSGTVNFSVEISRPNNSGVPIDGVTMFVDGQLKTIRFGSKPTGPTTATITVDTTQLHNGTHQLFAGVWTTEPNNPPVAMLQTAIKVDNGRVVSQLRSRWQTAYLVPGETTAISPRLAYTNGDEDAVSGEVAYSSSDSSVATVSSSGTVQALKIGYATITSTYQGRSASTRVVVSAAHEFPHFSKDGEILTQYDPARSLFVRSMFYLEPKVVKAKNGLDSLLKSAGVNALESGFYLNMSDLGNPTDFAGFRKSWDPWWNNIATTARQLGFQMVLTGDNMARGPQDLSNSINLPWSAQAIAHTFATLRDSKLATAIEMVDESSGVWGNTPQPTDGRWLSRTPPIPDNAFVKLMQSINQTPNRPPVSWPVLWLSGPQAAANWMGDPKFSDYASNYWDNADWRVAYPYGMSLGQTRSGLDNVVIARRHLMQQNRPALQLMSIAGSYYTKRGPGTEFTPGQDWLQSPGIRPESMAGQVLYAVATGQAGVRAYSYDWDRWKSDRANAAIGSRDLQTGAEPYQIGTDRWQAMAAAFRLVGQLEPYLLQPSTHAPDLGPVITTGAKQGSTGRVLIAINFSDVDYHTRVDLSPYSSLGATPATRYRLLGARLLSDTLASSNSDDLTFGPGEAVLWVFPNSGPPQPGASIVAPLAGASVSGTVSVVPSYSSGFTLSKSELRVDGNLVSTRFDSAPFQWDSSAAAPGTSHTLAVRAYFTTGQTADASTSVLIASPAAANVSPVVSITAPGNNASFTSPATIPITAAPSDSDGTISKVELYNGNTLLATLTASPYAFNWINVPAGTYSLTAKATDNKGSTGTSSPVTVTVIGPNVPPQVTLVSPANGSTSTAGSTISITAAAADTDGTIAKVELYNGGTLLATLTSSPYSFNWTNVPAGSYSVSAKATDNKGATATSPGVSFTVSPSIPAVGAGGPSGPGTIFVRGINLAGAATTIEGNTWLAHSAAVSSGILQTNATLTSVNYGFPLSPSADAGTKSMLQSIAWSPSTSYGRGFYVQQNIANGDYSVYIWAMENYRDNYRRFDLRLQGYTVASGIATLKLGQWQKYGPFPARVTNGVLRLDVLNAGKGDPAILGIAVYR